MAAAVFADHVKDDVSMLASIARTFPYIWPYRGRLLLSVVFALAVGVLWGANLSFAYPVFEILMNDQNLDEHAQQQIAEYKN